MNKGGKEIKGTDIHGTANAAEFESDSNGAFYVGWLDYGVYVLQETTVPTGYDGSKPFFYLVVDEDGADISSGYATADVAREAGTAQFKQRQTDRKAARQQTP